jgi:L-fuconate dehydratase
MDINIESVLAKDIRFPTGKFLDGSDAMNPDPDYSAAYVILKTDHPDGLEGYGLTFTIGRGNELCVQAIHSLSGLITGKTLQSFISDMAGFCIMITGDSQFRWLGPDKGVIHLATAAIVNAVWDLYAKIEKKPLWELIASMSPKQLLSCVDFSYICDVINPEEALDILQQNITSKQERIEQLMTGGFPAYTTSAGWLGYNDDKIRRLCRQVKNEGWKYIKMKVGSDINDDIRRAGLIREEIGYEIQLLMDANQKWSVDEAIKNIKQLSKFKPWWIEEPTSPDDILGHRTIAQAVQPVKIASGEHCQNRIMFKQFLASGAMDICQIDSCRLGGVNEVLAVMLMAAKYNIPVCPHAGGVGLCEYVQHLSMIDFICISANMENRIIEYVDHLHEHFLHPVEIKDCAYMPPTSPGFSIEMKPESLSRYEFPAGEYWQQQDNENI